MQWDISLLGELTGFAVIVAGATVWLRSALSKQRTKELELLAKTRGDRIEDQNDRIDALEETVGDLVAELRALTTLKVSEIADAVVVGLKPFLEKQRNRE
jgi:hypothetical protein